MTAARRAGTTSVATLFAVALTLAVSNWMAPGWSQAMGLDMWSVPSLQSEIESDAHRDRILTEEILESHRRMEVKEMLIEDMVQGRLALNEVVAEFQVLNRDRQSTMTAIGFSHPGKTEEQAQAWNVVDFALRRANNSWIKKVVILARFGKDYDRIFGSPSPAANRYPRS